MQPRFVTPVIFMVTNRFTKSMHVDLRGCLIVFRANWVRANWVRANWIAAILVAAILALAPQLGAQQTSGDFRWMDFHDAKDQNIVAWVARSLAVEKWTSIREIGLVYDAALVVTADRPSPQSPPNDDSFTVWNVSLTSHVVAPLISGVNLRWFDWQNFADNAPQELTVLYDNCHDCAASTYFTAFHYDIAHHMWAARWVRGGQGVLVWNATGPSAASGIDWTQLYAVMAGPDGRAFLATWNHFEYGKLKPPSDTLFEFDVDPQSGLERTVDLTRDEAEAMKLRICRGQNTVQGLERGQDSQLCQKLRDVQPQRKPVTTPPANNHGKSQPAVVRH